MNFHLGKKTPRGGKEVSADKSYFFAVEVGPNPESFESYMKRIFAGMGL